MSGPRSVELLKASWLRDPSWTLAETPGFDGYREDLARFEATWRAQWEREQVEKSQSEPRSDHQVLVSVAQLLEEELSELRHIRAAFERLSVNGESGGEERLPSITIEDMAKGDPKVTTKSYDGRPLTRSLVDQHLDAHAYAHRLAAAMAMDAWGSTVEALQRKGEPAA